jgi:hypothetical protein
MSSPAVLKRSISTRKIDFANRCLDEINEEEPGILFPGKKILLDMGLSCRRQDIFDMRDEFVWTVHYILITDKGEYEHCQTVIIGTKGDVYNQFSHELM